MVGLVRGCPYPGEDIAEGQFAYTSRAAEAMAASHPILKELRR